VTGKDRPVALITGGVGGIGREIVRRLLADGYSVVAADSAVDAKDNGEAMAGVPEGAVVHALDVTAPESVDACVAWVAQRGPIRALVNCAGILRHGLVEEVTDKAMFEVWDVNVAGMLRMCRAARPYMPSGSAIVNISSITATVGRMRGGAMYGGTKAAMEAMTRYLAVELAPAGIRVNALAPGFIEVLPMSASMRSIAFADNDADAVAWCVKQVPLARMGEPAEMAGPVSFLLSQDASYVTGHVLMADGGVAAA
jgi:3-oxoacyl-[acyl-carrier protein] reductase